MPLRQICLPCAPEPSAICRFGLASTLPPRSSPRSAVRPYSALQYLSARSGNSSQRDKSQNRRGCCIFPFWVTCRRLESIVGLAESSQASPVVVALAGAVSQALVAARREDRVPWRWCGDVALLVAPEDSIQTCGSGCVGAGEIHLRRLAGASGVALVGFVDEAVF